MGAKKRYPNQNEIKQMRIDMVASSGRCGHRAAHGIATAGLCSVLQL